MTHTLSVDISHDYCLKGAKISGSVVVVKEDGYETSSGVVWGKEKVVKIPLDKPESDLDCITKACRKDFGITESSMTFQRFDPTWDEYVDLEEDSEVHDKDKLKLVVMSLLTMPFDTSPSSEFEVLI